MLKNTWCVFANTIIYRIFVRMINVIIMKVTAIIPDELVRETQALSKSKNITEAMITALNVYISIERLKAMGEQINKNPLQFKHTAEEIREINRA